MQKPASANFSRPPSPDSNVAWLSALRDEQALISTVTLGEIQAGVERTRRQDAVKANEIENWLNYVETSFSLLPMEAACFREWSRLMEGKSRTLEPDAMIAATARVHGLTIATRDEKDFKRLEVEVFNPFKSTNS